MTQRQQRHPAGTFPRCPDCGGELRHIHDDRAAFGGHLLSCCCGDSPKFAEAQDLWNALYTWCALRSVAVPMAFHARQHAAPSPGHPTSQGVA